MIICLFFLFNYTFFMFETSKWTLLDTLMSKQMCLWIPWMLCMYTESKKGLCLINYVCTVFINQSISTLYNNKEHVQHVQQATKMKGTLCKKQTQGPLVPLRYTYTYSAIYFSGSFQCASALLSLLHRGHITFNNIAYLPIQLSVLIFHCPKKSCMEIYWLMAASND